MKIEFKDGRVFEFPDNCTRCGKDLSKVGGYPMPVKQYLCKECFHPALEKGCANLNRSLNSRKETEETNQMKQSEWFDQASKCPDCIHTPNFLEFKLCEKHYQILLAINCENKKVGP